MKEVLFFDMDDTLIPIQESFNLISERVARRIQEIIDKNLTLEEILIKKDEIDLENVKIMGFAPERYPTTWVQTLEHYGKEKCVEVESFKEEVYKIAYGLHEMNIDVYEGVYETLNTLKKKGYTLHLLTAGSNEVQEKRIAHSNFEDYFEKLIIVPMKNENVYDEILSEMNLNPQSTYMIGNSLKSDIHPALEVGMKVLHLDKKTWAFDEYEADREHKDYKKQKDWKKYLQILNVYKNKKERSFFKKS